MKGKVHEYRDYAAEKAKGIKEFLRCREVKGLYSRERKRRKLSETNEAARRKMEGMKLRGEEYKEDAAQEKTREH